MRDDQRLSGTCAYPAALNAATSGSVPRSVAGRGTQAGAVQESRTSSLRRVPRRCMRPRQAPSLSRPPATSTGSSGTARRSRRWSPTPVKHLTGGPRQLHHEAGLNPYVPICASSQSVVPWVTERRFCAAQVRMPQLSSRGDVSASRRPLSSTIGARRAWWTVHVEPSDFRSSPT